MVKVSMKLGLCLSGLLGIRLNSKRLVVFLDIYFVIHVHSMLNRTMLLFGVTCVILMSIMLVHVHIMQMCYFDSSLPLTQSMRPEIGEPFGLGASLA